MPIFFGDIKKKCDKDTSWQNFPALMGPISWTIHWEKQILNHFGDKIIAQVGILGSVQKWPISF